MSEYPFPNSRMPERVVYSAESISRECSNMLLWDIAPQQPGETVKGWLHRAAVATGLKQSVVKRIRYQEMPTIPAHVAFQLQAVAERARAARSRAKALKDENDHLLALARQGARIDWTAQHAGADASVCEEEDDRQLNLPLSGWMR